MPEMKARLGWRPDKPDYRDFRYGDSIALNESEALPEQVMVRGLSYAPLFDQGRLGSCVGASTSYMMQMVRRVAPRSVLQVYYEARRLINETDVDNGAYIRDGVKVLGTLGAGRSVWWPYNEANYAIDPPLTVDRDALKRRIYDYYRLDPLFFRTCLAAGYPFVIGFTVYTSFMGATTDRSGIALLPKAGETVLGGHAVCVIGYNDNFRASPWAQDVMAAGYPQNEIPEAVYIVRNSWGRHWGRDGDFAMDARYLEDTWLADDSWTIRNVAPPAPTEPGPMAA